MWPVGAHRAHLDSTARHRSAAFRLQDAVNGERLGNGPVPVCRAFLQPKGRAPMPTVTLDARWFCRDGPGAILTPRRPHSGQAWLTNRWFMLSVLPSCTFACPNFFAGRLLNSRFPLLSA